MKTKVAAYVFCCAAGAFLARFDLRTDDTGVEALFILAATFVLGCLHPRRAWQWALLVGPCAPAAELVFGTHPNLKDLPLIALFVIALGLAGSYAGVMLRKMASGAARPTAP